MPSEPSDLDRFIQSYRRGELQHSRSTIPAQPAALSEEANSGQVLDTDCDAEKARRLFSTMGLVAPRPENEQRRMQSIVQAGLLHAEGSETIQRAYRLALRVVPKDSHVFLSLVGPDAQSIIIGPNTGPLVTGATGARDSSFCAHTMLSQEGLDIPDAMRDWRFKNNEHVRAGTIRAYSGLPMRTRRLSDGSSSSEGEENAVGAFCVYSANPRETGPFLDEETREILEDLADIIARELESQGRRKQQRKETRMREAAAVMLEASADKQTMITGDDTVFYNKLTQNIGETLESSIVCIWDMRAFSNAVVGESAQRTLRLLGFWSESQERHILEGRLRMESAETLETLLGHCRGARGFSHVYNSRQEALQSPYGPYIDDATQTLLALPLFAPDRELILLLTISSSDAYAHFSDADNIFIAALGRIAVAEVLRERLLAADAAKTAFVARISHELRTPLHGLQSQISLIRDVCTEDMALILEQYLETADVCASSLRDIVEDILDFGKISSASIADLEENALALAKARRRVDLEHLLRDLVRICLLRKKQIDAIYAERDRGDDDVQMLLEVQELPQGCWDVEIDAAGFARIVQNILVNAIKFTPQGIIRASMRLLPEKSACEVTISDTGKGMSSEFLRDGLFRPFQQEHTFSGGTGLGLNICQAIVRRMKGTIQISSKLGVGTTVCLILPLQVETAPAVEALTWKKQRIIVSAPSSPAKVGKAQKASAHMASSSGMFPVAFDANSGAPREKSPHSLLNGIARAQAPTPVEDVQERAKLRCLVVDDNAISRRVLTTVVSRAGVAYEQAVDGLQAFDVFKAFRPHLTLTDQSMPRLDGLGCAQLIRKYEAEHGWPRSQIICISAHPRPAILDPALDDWLVKGKLDVSVTRALIVRMQSDLAAATLAATTLLSASPVISPSRSPKVDTRPLSPLGAL